MNTLGQASAAEQGHGHEGLYDPTLDPREPSKTQLRAIEAGGSDLEHIVPPVHQRTDDYPAIGMIGLKGEGYVYGTPVTQFGLERVRYITDEGAVGVYRQKAADSIVK